MLADSAVSDLAGQCGGGVPSLARSPVPRARAPCVEGAAACRGIKHGHKYEYRPRVKAQCKYECKHGAATSTGTSTNDTTGASMHPYPNPALTTCIHMPMPSPARASALTSIIPRNSSQSQPCPPANPAARTAKRAPLAVPWIGTAGSALAPRALGRVRKHWVQLHQVFAPPHATSMGPVRRHRVPERQVPAVNPLCWSLEQWRQPVPA